MKKSIFIFALYLFFSSSLLAKVLTLSCPHKVIPLNVELAQTSEEQERGLMFRTHLAQDEGMLFLFPQAAPVAMWMKNTPLSLDMLFADKKGKILAIYENTDPFSLETIGPVQGTSQVLEVLGGTVKREGIAKECTLSLHGESDPIG